MRLIKIEKLPRIGDGPRYRMTFDNDGKQYVKIKPFGFHGWSEKRELVWSLLRGCLEAERDVAYDLFGQGWRSHVGPFKISPENPFLVDCLEKIECALTSGQETTHFPAT